MGPWSGSCASRTQRVRCGGGSEFSVLTILRLVTDLGGNTAMQMAYPGGHVKSVDTVSDRSSKNSLSTRVLRSQNLRTYFWTCQERRHKLRALVHRAGSGLAGIRCRHSLGIDVEKRLAQACVERYQEGKCRCPDLLVNVRAIVHFWRNFISVTRSR